MKMSSEKIVLLHKKYMKVDIIKDIDGYRTVLTSFGHEYQKQIMIKTASVQEENQIDDASKLVFAVNGTLGKSIGANGICYATRAAPHLIAVKVGDALRFFSRTSEGTEFIVLEEIVQD